MVYFGLKKSIERAGEMGQWFRVCAELPEDLGLVPASTSGSSQSPTATLASTVPAITRTYPHAHMHLTCN